MNTPAHVLIAVASLTSGRRRPFARHALVGALLPDLPMFGFYLWQRGYMGLPEPQIWTHAYYRPNWQLLFDGFHSAPLALLGLAIVTLAAPAWRLGVQVFFAAILLHIATDLPLHHDDGHRHFLPISDWRFASPVSYWDPAHAGRLGAGFELVCVLIASVVLWRRFELRWVRSLVGLFCGLSIVGYTTFYWLLVA